MASVGVVWPGVPSSSASFTILRMPLTPTTEPTDMRKAQLKKHLRGVRPIERALEEGSTPENDVIRSYCLAIRAALTDDGRSPLHASGLRLHDRVTLVSDSIARGKTKKDCHQL